jgi:hypothetical protein
MFGASSVAAWMLSQSSQEPIMNTNGVKSLWFTVPAFNNVTCVGLFVSSKQIF